MSLCYRCEHRAINKEDPDEHPRYECGTDDSVGSCYMYKPVKPVLLSPNKGDDRPVFAGSLISARMRRVEMPEDLMELEGKEISEGKYVLYWRLK